MPPDPHWFRPPRARVAIAFSTKDRGALTRRTLAPLLDDARFDLHWFDGSATLAGQRLPLALCPGHAAPCALHAGVTGGPDRAILLALERLRAASYALVILLENDVLVEAGWYEALLDSMDRARAHGFAVGAASARVARTRVLSFNGDHCLLLHAGAGLIALTQEAIEIVVATYRTGDTAELAAWFQAIAGIDVAAMLGLAPGPLPADGLFEAQLYLRGLVVSAPAATYASNIDPEGGAQLNTELVRSTADHLPAVHGLITRPGQFCAVDTRLTRFASVRGSGRKLVGCHQLRLALDRPGESQAVCAQGPWRHQWSQSCGPFTLFGAGRLSIVLHGQTVGVLLYTGATGARLRLSAPGGPAAEAALPAHAMTEVPLDPALCPAGTARLDVIEGELGFVGLTADSDVLPLYANARTDLSYLPA